MWQNHRQYKLNMVQNDHITLQYKNGKRNTLFGLEIKNIMQPFYQWTTKIGSLLKNNLETGNVKIINFWTFSFEKGWKFIIGTFLEIIKEMDLV